MIIRSLRKPSALVFILAAGVGLSAQEMGTLRGTVTDAAGNPVADARVSISSPNMLQVRNLSTNARGEYVAPLLPAGNFSITISKSGFVGRKADNIRVGLGATVNQNFTLTPTSQASATVEIFGEAFGQVDKTETKMGSSFSADLINTLPVDKRFGGAANFTAGVVSGAGGLVIRGGTSAQTLYRVDGADVKDEYQNAQIGLQIVPDNIEDIQVVLSELHARFGRSLGGSINAVTKSGSNTLSGSIRSEIYRSSWSTQSVYATWWAQYYWDNEMQSDALGKEWQMTLNGPIIKDRLWFAISAMHVPGRPGQNRIYNYWNNGDMNYRPVQASGDPNDAVNSITLAGPEGYTWSRMDANKTYTTTRDIGRYDLKLTGSLGQNHTFDFAYTNEWDNFDLRNKFGDGGMSVSRLAALGPQESTRQNYIWGYRGILTNSLFLEARYSKLDNTIDWPHGDMSYGGTNEYIRVYAGYPGVAGGQSNYGHYAFPFGNGSGYGQVEERSNRSGNINLKWITDLGSTSHELDFGFDHFEGILKRDTQAGGENFRIYVGGIYENLSGLTGSSNDDYRFPAINYPGAGVYGTSTGNPEFSLAPTRRDFYFSDGQNRNPGYAFYVNDKFVINQHWNAMVGVRVQNSTVNDTDGPELANTTFVSPRFQVKYDIKGDNSHVLGLTAARYGGDFQTQFTDSFVKWGSAVYVTRGWSANPYEAYDTTDPLLNQHGQSMAGVRWISYNDFYNKDNFQRIVDFGDVSKNMRVDPDLRTPYMDELTLSYRRQWTGGSNLSFTYVNRTWKQQWARILVYGEDSLTVLTDPSNSGLPDQYITHTYITNSNDMIRDFQSLEIDFEGRINNYWLIGGNWTISRLTGNDNGGDGGDNWTDSSATQYYWHFPLLQQYAGVTRDDIAPYGRLNNDQPQRGRLFAVYSLPVGKGKLDFSWTMQYNAARPSSIQYYQPVTVPSYIRPDGNPMSHNRPTAYQQYYNQQRGWLSGNDTFSLDFGLSCQLPLGLPGWGSSVQFIGNVEIRNVMNHQGDTGMYFSTSMGSSTAPTTRAWYSNNPAYWGQSQNPYPPTAAIGVNTGGYQQGGRWIQCSFGLKF